MTLCVNLETHSINMIPSFKKDVTYWDWLETAFLLGEGFFLGQYKPRWF